MQPDCPSSHSGQTTGRRKLCMKHPLERFCYCPVCGSSAFPVQDEKSRRCETCGFEYYLNPSSAYVAVITDKNGRLLVERRGREPALGTLDLPGGFADIGETAEQGVAREVREETGLEVTHVEYLFSIPNTSFYSGMCIPTLDMFFRCRVADDACLQAGDDASDCMWLSPHEINPEAFGLHSIRMGIEKMLHEGQRG